MATATAKRHTTKTTKTGKLSKPILIGTLAKDIQKKVYKPAWGGKAELPVKVRKPKIERNYTGAPIPATRVFQLDLSEKFAKKNHWKKGTSVEVMNWMIINEQTDPATVTYCNTYHGTPKASWNPDTYRYPMEGHSLRVATAKMELFVELEPTEWPEWITSAGPKKSRKTSK